MQLKYVFDQALSSLPSGFVTALDAVATFFDNLITNNITVTIEVGYGEITQDGSSTPVTSGAEGGPDNGTDYTYSQLKTILAANATSPAQITALDNLPAADPSKGGGIYVASAQQKALGLIAADGTEIDGSVGFQVDGAGGTTYDFDPNDRAVSNEWDFLGVAEHEISHAMGRISNVDTGSTDITLMDLYRYSAPGKLDPTNASPVDYFSINGGKTNLDNFDLSSDPADWADGTGNDSFDATGALGVENPVTATDMTLLNVIGFDTSFALSDLTSLAYKASYEAVWNPSTGVLTIIDTANGNATVTTLNFAGLSFTGQLVTLASDGNGGVAVGLAPLALVTVGSGDVVFSNVSGEPFSAFENIYNGSQLIGTDYFYTNITAQPYSAYEDEYTGGNDFVGSRFLYTNVSNETYTAYEYDYDGGGNVTREAFTGVSGATYSAYEYDFVAGVYAGAKFDFTAVPTGATYSAYEIDYNFANRFSGEKLFFTGVTGQSYTGEEVDFDGSGALARVLFTGFTGSSYSSLELDYNAGAYAGYKAFYTVSGQSYTGVEIDVSATNQITKSVYTGLTGTPYSSVEEDFSNGAPTSTTYDFTNQANQNYSAYQAIDDANGNPLQEIVDNNNGSHTIAGFQDNETFTSIGNDTFTGGGSGETFVFNPVYGHDTITDFYKYVTGATHDTISVSTTEFTNIATLLGDTQNVGANAVITAQNGDKITLDNVSVSTLAANQGDFTFHA